MANWADQRIIAGSASDKGRVRDHNEDAYLVDSNRSLFIVSDGMGGAQAGALASKIVIEFLPRIIDDHLARLEKVSTQTVRKVLHMTILELSQRMYKESSELLHLRGTGATLVLLLIRGRWAHIAHVGDSRAYFLRRGILVQLTEDHSIVGILMRHGDITPEQAKTHPARGRLSQCIGMEGEVCPDVRTVALRHFDRILLCTDGLTGAISQEEIKALLRDNANPMEACRAMVEAANRASGGDNITAVVVDWA